MVNEKYEDIGVEWIDGFIQVSDGNNLYNIKEVIDQLNEQDKCINHFKKEILNLSILLLKKDIHIRELEQENKELSYGESEYIDEEYL